MTRDEAYEAAHIAYVDALLGREQADYEGDFDVAGLIESAPSAGTDPRDHRACWAEFRRLFAERWREYERREIA